MAALVCLTNLQSSTSLTLAVAEKTFLILRKLAQDHRGIQFIAVSHSDKSSTDRWIESIGGDSGVEVIVDNERHIYSQYGLGVASFWHVLNPWSLGSVFKMAREEKIVNRPTESGNRWQTSGVFAVDASGVVKYAHPAQTSDDLGDPEAAVKALQNDGKL